MANVRKLAHQMWMWIKADIVRGFESKVKQTSVISVVAEQYYYFDFYHSEANNVPHSCMQAWLLPPVYALLLSRSLDDTCIRGGTSLPDIVKACYNIPFIPRSCAAKFALRAIEKIDKLPTGGEEDLFRIAHIMQNQPVTRDVFCLHNEDDVREALRVCFRKNPSAKKPLWESLREVTVAEKHDLDFLAEFNQNSNSPDVQLQLDLSFQDWSSPDSNYVVEQLRLLHQELAKGNVRTIRYCDQLLPQVDTLYSTERAYAWINVMVAYSAAKLRKGVNTLNSGDFESLYSVLESHINVGLPMVKNNSMRYTHNGFEEARFALYTNMALLCEIRGDRMEPGSPNRQEEFKKAERYYDSALQFPSLSPTKTIPVQIDRFIFRNKHCGHVPDKSECDQIERLIADKHYEQAELSQSERFDHILGLSQVRKNEEKHRLGDNFVFEASKSRELLLNITRENLETSETHMHKKTSKDLMTEAQRLYFRAPADTSPPP